MLGSGLNLVTTVIGFGMSATFIVFVCARLICGRAARADAEADAAAARAMAPGPAPFDFDIEFRTADLGRTIENTCSGLEPFVVAAIPTMTYSSEAFRSKDDAQCSICLGEYDEKEILRIMPTCRHNFHLSCIDIWLQKQTTCPICRISLDLPGGKTIVSPARSRPQLSGHPESSAGRSPHWILPMHRDRGGGRGNRPASQESLEVQVVVT
ncbi:RING-H2 finger protein ATL73-like [Hordeum vulgare subsp. vulgare]|uniref:RING-type domain-containing protein n=1 Tax=Hordeum vulgare subsp. vulgare TaxID=112509 RepID=A0A8I6YKU7_HORVV|nr:RING-H2 finger protein ATL73-like [Hordeum vulgare subsp. vulgare]